MRIKRINWLNDCAKCKCKCENYNHYVETSSEDCFMLYEGDKVSCGACDHKGIIEIFGDIAEVQWDCNN